MTRFFPLLLLLAIPSFLSAQQPCLEVLLETGCPANPLNEVNSSTNFIPFKHTDIRSGLTTDTAARYKAFWIFGDGNYKSFPDNGTKAEDEATLSTTYAYDIGDSYLPTVVLVEKKSDDRPTRYNARRVKVPTAATGNNSPLKANDTKPRRDVVVPASEFNNRITSPATADIEASSKVRLGGYETAFATSTILPASGSQGVVVFLYNSVKLRDGGNFEAQTLFPEAELQRANYNNATTVFGNTNDLPEPLKSIIPRFYKNVIIQPLQVDFNKKPSRFDEFRTFPILRTKPRDASGNLITGIVGLDTTGMGETQFVVMVIDNAGINPTYNPADESEIITLAGTNTPLTNSPSEIAHTWSLLGQHFREIKSLFDSTTLSLNNGMLLRGFAYHSEQLVTSIDPTELRILSICPKDGKYDVDMKATVCNEGNMKEELVTVDIRNPGGILIQHLACDSSQFTRPVAATTSDAMLSFVYENLPGYYQALPTTGHNCFDVYFSFQTDWNGALKLAAGGALVSKVNFKNAVIKPTQEFPNIPVETNLINEKTGYNCGGGKDNCVWLIVLAFALFIVFWWLWKNNQKED